LTSGAPGPVGTLQVALDHAARLLGQDPALAAEQATEILKSVPGHPVATLILGSAQRASGNLPAAITTLEALARAEPKSAATLYELSLALAAAGRGEAAVTALRRALQLKPDLADGWRRLGDHLSAMGDAAGADAAYANHVKAATRDPRLLAPAAALTEGRIADAESLLREHLAGHPTDVAALRMLAEVSARLGRYTEAEQLLARCLELSPSFSAARHNYAIVLQRLGRSEDALREVDGLLATDPRNSSLRSLKAAALARLGEYERSIALYESVLEDYPGQAKLWMSLGHAVKTTGRQQRCIEVYRRSIELEPSLGEAWWSLANLKTYRFGADDVAAMRAQVVRTDLADEDRLHFHFALGKALEDAGEYAESFHHYAAGNALRRRTLNYDARETTELVNRSCRLFTPGFFAQRGGTGCPAPDPIFIVGLPRAGSTLVEQILASHPRVEGTMELPDLPSLVRDLSARNRRSDPSRYPDVLADLNPDQLRALGERYLAQTRIQRKTAAPFFIDKMPNNWAHVGLIQLILPNARVIDARRHPLSCCFSGFKQHFARGQGFTYSLEDLGRYYSDYVRLMAHYDAVLPGRVHRVIYERMVEDTETEVRRLLEYCGLEFDERCLRFYETDRAVRTASSEQVRSPIFRDGVERWRHYAAFLGPLEQALGPVLAAYPDAPAFAGDAT
jgi:tetratricopeptide (TPR) repeat protein